MRDVVRDYAFEALADPDGVLVIDETGFLKQGRSSCGVGRQYTGSAGKITNCQVGVFTSHVSRHGHAFIDRALYLPRAWADDAARRTAAHVPAEVGFATKPRMAVQMVGHAIAAGVAFAWVAADAVYGVGELEMALRQSGKGYVLGVGATHQFHSWSRTLSVSGTAEDIAKALNSTTWRRLSAGKGIKGARLCDWAYLELADLEADMFNPGPSGAWTRGLLVRRSLADGACAYFTTWCPTGTAVEKLVEVEGHRWAEAAKVPPAQQGKSCRRASRTASSAPKPNLAWTTTKPAPGTAGHRHVSLVMLAFAMMASIRRHANQPTPQKTP